VSGSAHGGLQIKDGMRRCSRRGAEAQTGHRNSRPSQYGILPKMAEKRLGLILTIIHWWQDMCREDSTLRTYKEFKNTIEIENCLLTKTEQLHMYRAWTIYGPEKKTPIQHDVLEDEKHFIQVCPLYTHPHSLVYNLKKHWPMHMAVY